MNARTRDEIGYAPCRPCDALGWVRVDGQVHTCLECLGSKRMLAETPRYAVQRFEGRRWETLLRVDGDKWSDAQAHREAYEKERPGVYRIVQEVDEEYCNPKPGTSAPLGSYAEQMIDAGRGHLLRDNEKL